jgi:hypothetical protein
VALRCLFNTEVLNGFRWLIRTVLSHGFTFPVSTVALHRFTWAASHSMSAKRPKKISTSHYPPQIKILIKVLIKTRIKILIKILIKTMHSSSRASFVRVECVIRTSRVRDSYSSSSLISPPPECVIRTRRMRHSYVSSARFVQALLHVANMNQNATASESPSSFPPQCLL